MKCKTARQYARAEARKAAKAQAEAAAKLVAGVKVELAVEDRDSIVAAVKQPSAAKLRKATRRQHENSCSRGRQGAPRGPRRNAATGELDPLDCNEALLQRVAA